MEVGVQDALVSSVLELAGGDRRAVTHVSDEHDLATAASNALMRCLWLRPVYLVSQKKKNIQFNRTVGGCDWCLFLTVGLLGNAVLLAFPFSLFGVLQRAAWASLAAVGGW